MGEEGRHERRHPVHLPPRRWINPNEIVFVTVCTRDHKPILAHQDVHETILASWIAADEWLVGHYVIMPDHVHLYCMPRSRESVSLEKWAKYWKSLASRSWPRPSEHPVWQHGHWDTQLRTGESYDAKAFYMRNNPVRKKLVGLSKDWPYQGQIETLEWHG